MLKGLGRERERERVGLILAFGSCYFELTSVLRGVSKLKQFMIDNDHMTIQQNICKISQFEN